MRGHDVQQGADAEQCEMHDAQQGAQAEQCDIVDTFQRFALGEPTSSNAQPLAVGDAEQPPLPSQQQLPLVLRTRISKWEVKFPKAWYDIDWWYYGYGRIQQLIENAYATEQETVVFDAVTHGEPTRYEINFRSWTQRNLTTGRIRQIRRR